MALIIPQHNLASLNTLAVSVSASAYVQARSREDVVEALAYAKKHSLPVLPLGGGSNLVLTRDVPALVLHIRLAGIECVHETADDIWVKVQAGENWHEFVCHSLNQDWYGLENLSLIPGSVGAAPIQNIGAYGVELEAVVQELTAIQVDSALPVTFDRDSCEFGYRDSVFKGRLKDQYVIVDVTFRLSKKPRLQLGYPALASRLEAVSHDNVTPQAVSDAVCAIRREKLPDPTSIPNVGSFFKNPLIDSVRFDALRREYPDIVGHPTHGSQIKLAAAWLIDRAGFKGVQQGPARVHERQALVLTNPGRGSGTEVLALAARIQAAVWDKYRVRLEIEPRVYPPEDRKAI